MRFCLTPITDFYYYLFLLFYIIMVYKKTSKNSKIFKKTMTIYRYITNIIFFFKKFYKKTNFYIFYRKISYFTIFALFHNYSETAQIY